MKRFVTIVLAFMLMFTGIFVSRNEVYAQDEETIEITDNAEGSESKQEEEIPAVEEVTEETEEAPALPQEETAEEGTEASAEQESDETQDIYPVQESIPEKEEVISPQSEPETASKAYALLNADGDLVFMRSYEDYDNDTYGTLIDTDGYSYTGTIFSNVEDTGTEVPWLYHMEEIKSVYAYDEIRPKTMYRWFRGAKNLIDFYTVDIDFSQVTSMEEMFEHCEAMEVIDLSDADVSSVVDMSWLFNSCFKLEYIDLSGWDTSKVENMSAMFHKCVELTDLFGLNEFDTSNVTGMYYMFLDCAKLTDLDLSSFDTSKVIGMGSMFHGCSSLTTLDLSNFNTANVTDMSYMFYECESLTSLDLSSFDTVKVEYMEGMFSQCHDLETIDVSSFNTANVKTMDALFSGCHKLTRLDLHNFNTSKVPNMTNMFVECYALEELDISSFETSAVYTMQNMFGSDDALTSIKLGTGFTVWFDDALLPSGTWKNEAKGLTKTEKELQEGYPANAKKWAGTWKREFPYAILTDDGSLIFTRSNNYYEDSSYDTVLDIKGRVYTGIVYGNIEKEGFMPGWQGSSDIKTVLAIEPIKPKTMQEWFNACSNLESFNARNFDTSECTSFYWLFRYCSSLKEIDLHTFDTSNVTTMNCLFAGATQLADVNVSGWNTSKVTDMAWMFSDCFSLEKLDLSSFDTSNVNDMYDLLYRCDDLVEIKLGPKWTKWISDYSSLSEKGTWENEAKGLIKSSAELYNDYPQNAADWSGTWKLRLVCAVLTDDGDLVFLRTKTPQVSGHHVSVESLSGGTYTGTVFTNVEAFKGSYPLYSPWYEHRDDIKYVYAVDEIKPLTTKYWFYECTKLESFAAENFNTSLTVDMEAMFDNCLALNKLDLSSFDTSNVVSMHSMFSGDEALEELNISGFDTAKVKEMTYMFYQCEKLKELDLSSFNTANVTSMYCMFSSCETLEELDLSNFDTAKLEDGYTGMNYMFQGCTALKKLDLGNFDTSNMTEMEGLFEYCNALEEVTLGPKWTKWLNDSYLPAGTWTNGTLYLDEIQLYNGYPANAGNWNGTWIKSDKGQYGDIIDPEDKSMFDVYQYEGLWTSYIPDRWYTGEAWVPSFRVYDHKTLLKEGTDYTVKYANNTNAGTATITITGKGNYQGTLVRNFEIYTAGFDYQYVNHEYLKYNGKVQKPGVTVIGVGGKKLKAGKDYDVEYIDTSYNLISPKAKGDYYVLIKGKGNYLNSNATMGFTITDKTPVDTLKVTLSQSKFKYDGLPHEPTMVIKNGKEVIYDNTEGLDTLHKVSVSFLDDQISVGKHYFSISSISSDLVGYNVMKEYEITGTPLSKVKIEYFEKKMPYLGYPVIQGINLTYNGISLTYGTDYEASYENNIEVGTATMILTGKGGYTGTVKKTFRIYGDPFNAKTIEVTGLEDKIYSGEEIKQDSLTLKDVNFGWVLAPGTSYTVSYKNNIKAGKATVTFTGINGYEGSFSKTFNIKKAKIESGNVTLGTNYPYNKGGSKPDPAVVVNGKKLTAGTDYALTYKNNTKPGTATLTLKGKGNYEGTITKSFTVRSSYAGNVRMTAADKVYSLKPAVMKTAVTLTDSNGKKLTAGTDYDKNVVYVYDQDVILEDGTSRNKGDAVEKSDIIPAGTLIKATVSMKGNYYGTIAKTFRIVAASIAKATVSVKTQYYNGMAISLKKSDITVKVAGSVLKDEDFEIVSVDCDNKVGKGSVTIKGVGDYGDTKTVKFTIAKRSMGITVKFYPNGATSGNMKDQLFYKDGKLTANAYKRTLAGKTYGFDGWNTKWDGSGIAFTDKSTFDYDSFEPGTTVFLYAQWKEMP